MYSVFSDYLMPLIEANIIRTKPTKPSEVYNQLRIAYNQGVTGILDNTVLLVSNSSEDEIEYDIIYEIWQNKELLNVVHWINENITLRLGIDDYRTINVKIRIATGMIDKLVRESKLSLKVALSIYSNFGFNVQNEMSLINTEDLPF